MRKQKTEQRKAAELIARQRGIKVTSAQAGLRRAAKTGKPYKAAGLTKYAAAKARKAVKQYKAEIVRGWRKTKPETKRVKGTPRARPGRPFPQYRPNDRRVVSVFGEFNFYGSDRRTRAIRFELSGSELNAFLQAESRAEAAEVLKRSNAGQFLGGAEKFGSTVSVDIERFTLDGKTQNAEIFDD